MTRGELAGPIAELSTDGSIDCKPVSEPSLVTMLIVSLVAVGVASALRRVVDRWLFD